MLKNRYILFFIYCLSAFTVQAQKSVADSLATADLVYTKLELPPLKVFLDAIYSNATVKMYGAKKEEELAVLQINKRDWLKYFKIQGFYQYGIINSNQVTSDTQTPIFNTYHGNMQHTYNGGVAFAMPLDDIFNRKYRIKAQRARVKQVEYEYEQELENRKLKILETYNAVLEHLTLLKVKSEAVALYDAQMRISETDFINGKISIITLSLERARRTTAVVNFQESKAALHNSITLLEMLTNVEIIQKQQE